MTDKEFVLDTMRAHGLNAAQALQVESANMTGTEIYNKEEYIPDFAVAVAAKNMLDRNAGSTDGFLCLSSAGRVVRLIQNYDSSVYTQEPEELPSQWGFYWSTDPTKALPFVSIATSPYNTDDCCTFEEHVWKSGQDGNVWEPGTINIKWTDLGTIDEVMNGIINEPDEEEPEDGEQLPDEDDVITAERGMEYVYGQKYLDPEDGNTYLCKRTGEADGGKVTLYYLPHELIGQYFELVE